MNEFQSMLRQFRLAKQTEISKEDHVRISALERRCVLQASGEKEERKRQQWWYMSTGAEIAETTSRSE